MNAGPADLAEVERIVRAAGTSFHRGMRILPPDRRAAMYAIYAFCRIVDDIADEPGADPALRTAALNAWRDRVSALYVGEASEPVTRVLRDAARRYALRETDFRAVIDGMQMDADAVIVAPRLCDLDLYCDRVAAAVGRLSVRAFGDASAAADAVAHHLGRALQYTNILRDLREDAERGRLYLPREWLDAAGLQPTLDALAAPALPQVTTRMAEVARGHFAAAAIAMERCDRRAMRPARIMAAGYRAVLDALERRGWARLDQPPRISAWRKLRILAAGLGGRGWRGQTTAVTPANAATAVAPAGTLDVCEPGRIAGWVRLPGLRAPRLELWAGPTHVADTIADLYRSDLAAAGIGDGRHGFVFEPARLTRHDIAAVTIVVAGTDYLLAPDARSVTPRARHAGSIYRRRHAPDPAAKQFKTCILHIGTEKTGSSTLQTFLWRNKTAFARHGIFLPVALTPHARAEILNHEYLSILACDEAPHAPSAAPGHADAAAQWALRAEVFDRFDVEAAAAPPNCTRLLLSSEHCHSRVITPQAIARVRALLEPFCEGFEIHVYLRPQHELAMSRFGMALMLGALDCTLFPRMPPGAATGEALYFDYRALLDRWGAVFGSAALHPHIFTRATLVGGTITDDVLDALALDPADFAPCPDIGGNVSAAAQRFLQRLYRTPEGQALSIQSRVWISERLRDAAPGRGALPARADALSFLDQFAASNEAVRRTWFADRPNLFNPDLSRLPDVAETADPADDAMLPVFLKILEAARRR